MLFLGTILTHALPANTINSGNTKLEQGHKRNNSKTEEALKLWKIEESSSEFTLYDFPELAAATDSFSEENKLGQGGFGPVYKASGYANSLPCNAIDQWIER